MKSCFHRVRSGIYVFLTCKLAMCHCSFTLHQQQRNNEEKTVDNQGALLTDLEAIYKEFEIKSSVAL